MKATVMFVYDEESRKWEVVVSGVENENDARDAFAAVVATMRMIDFRLQIHAPVENTGDGYYKITPAVL